MSETVGGDGVMEGRVPRHVDGVDVGAAVQEHFQRPLSPVLGLARRYGAQRGHRVSAVANAPRAGENPPPAARTQLQHGPADEGAIPRVDFGAAGQQAAKVLVRAAAHARAELDDAVRMMRPGGNDAGKTPARHEPWRCAS